MTSQERHIETITIDWQGIALSVSYERNWLNIVRENDGAAAHLQIQTASGEPLPITETGYRSHFLHPSNIDAAGGPVAYVRAWLDNAAATLEWRQHLEATRQMTLF